jgi:hypothetical protein
MIDGAVTPITVRAGTDRSQGISRTANFEGVQYCTDGPTLTRYEPAMTGTSFYHLKAERCARLAEDEVDPRRRLELETESRLWRHIAVAEDNLEESRKKARDFLNAQPVDAPALRNL